MARMKLRVALAASSVATALLGACPPASLEGQPCAEAGEEQCEGDALLRCDGRFYLRLADCAVQCKGEEAQVTHSGTISADETWTCAEGPHLVSTGTLAINDGVTLTIEPGTQVRLDPAARISAGAGGRVDALGDVNAPILVTSNTGEIGGFGDGDEGGINVSAVQSGEPSRIEHTIVERGIHGVVLFGLAEDATPPIVENSTFRDNQRFGVVLLCNGDDVEVPDFTATNQFFGNEGGDVSGCNPDL